MLDKEISILGMKGKKSFPSSSDEFNSLAKLQGSKVEDSACAFAVTFIQMHRFNSEARDIFLHGQEEKKNENNAVVDVAIEGVDKITGILRLEKVVIDKKTGKPKTSDGMEVTEWAETQEQYFDRVLVELVKREDASDEDEARAYFQDHFNKVIELTEVNLGTSSRKGVGPKLAAKHKIFAAKILALSLVEKFNKKLQKILFKTFTPTNDTSTMFNGKYPETDPKTKETTEVEFSVSDKDAQALGNLIKDYREAIEAQEAALLSD